MENINPDKIWYSRNLKYDAQTASILADEEASA